MTDNYKPQLITNDPIPENTPYPRFSSVKRHGICIIIKENKDLILGRSLKPIKNIQFQERFKPVLDYCTQNNIILQGECHINGAVSDDIIRFTNTLDLNDISSSKLKDLNEKIEKGTLNFNKDFYLTLPNSMKIYIFDSLKKIDNEYFTDELYVDRHNRAKDVCLLFPDLLEIIPQIEINNNEEAIKHYNECILAGHEGSVERFNKGYKTGRSTQKEYLIYKRLPKVTFDGKIIAVNQATIVDENAERTINELGRSVTSKKKDDRILIEKAKDFQVEMIPEGQTEAINFGVSMATFDDEDRKEVWKNPDNYIGKMIEFKCKEYVGIGHPKNAVFIRFREDRD